MTPKPANGDRAAADLVAVQEIHLERDPHTGLLTGRIVVGELKITQKAADLCDWCGVNLAQRPNGECDDCWHLPGHEGEGEPTLEEERRNRDFEALRTAYALQAETVARLRGLLTALKYRIEMGHWSDVESYLPQIAALLAGDAANESEGAGDG